MGSDRARRSYDPSRRYRSVVQQQGRVTLESDANEAEEIRADASRAELIDLVGPTGSPDDGFKISVLPLGLHLEKKGFPLPADRDLAIGEGTLYVGGMRVQCTPAQATYQEQWKTEWVDAPPRGTRRRLPAAGGNEMVYLVLWEQEVSAVEDPALLDVALGGPDTTARTRLVQRVQRHAIHGSTCKAGVKELLKEVYPPSHFVYDRKTCQLTSKMQLRVDYAPEDAEESACQPTAQAGFLGPDNQLIRVQVSEEKKLLWAFDDASTLFRATISADGLVVELKGAPVDEVHQPHAGQYLEVLATAVDLGGGAQIASAVGVVRRVADYDPTERTVKLQTALPPSCVKSKIVAAEGLDERQARPRAEDLPVYVRLWENQHEFPKAKASTELFKADGNSTGVCVFVNGAGRVPGDYWMVGVRPARPSQVLPARLKEHFQPPDGPRRWGVPLAVIQWGSGGNAKVTDCRRRFQSLGDNDLAFHNRHLHGWGVVCGLQVTCLADCGRAANTGECVQVADGYAIDPTGVDIRLQSEADDARTPVPVGQIAVADGILTRRADGTIADGALSLWIDRNGGFHADPYKPNPSPLEGTLYKRIFQDCILKVLGFLEGELTPGDRQVPVDGAAQRLAALFNVYAQVLFKARPPIYLSGESAPAAGTEDAILRTLFDELKALLQSHTFCAMFDDVLFPAYDVYRAPPPAAAKHPTTIFGPRARLSLAETTGSHTELRASPSGRWGLAFGGESTIHVYDLAARRLAAIVDLPIGGEMGPTPIAKGVAFPPEDDGHVHVVVHAGGTDSVYLTGTVGQDGKISWDARRQVCPGLALRDVVIAGGDTFAAAVGKGVYLLRGDHPPMQIGPAIPASGHLVAHEGERRVLYAGAAVPGKGVEIVALPVVKPGPSIEGRYLAMPLEGARLIAMTLLPPTASAKEDVVALVSDPKTKAQRLVSWEAESAAPSPAQAPPPYQQVELGTAAGASGLAYSAAGDWVLITCEGDFSGRVYRRGSAALEDAVHPLQVLPRSPVAAGDSLCVLNVFSRTITVIPASNVLESPWVSAIDALSLASYQRAVLAAFVKLFNRCLQYLKDCACEHMMIECPHPDGKVYLADVTFKGGKVYQICNARRKYVHTFPTVEYWLSLVPIIPLLERFMESFCSKVLVDGFTAVGPISHGDVSGGGRTHVAMAVNAGTWIASLLPLLGQRREQMLAAIRYAQTRLTELLSEPKKQDPAVRIPGRIINLPAEEATRIAASEGVAVRRVVIASGGAEEVGALLRSPVAAPGEEVDLVTDGQGRVLGWRKAAPRPAPAAVSEEVAGLRRQLEAVTKEHERQAATVADLEKRLAEMVAAVSALRR